MTPLQHTAAVQGQRRVLCPRHRQQPHNERLCLLLVPVCNAAAIGRSDGKIDVAWRGLRWTRVRSCKLLDLPRTGTTRRRSPQTSLALRRVQATHTQPGANAVEVQLLRLPGGHH